MNRHYMSYEQMQTWVHSLGPSLRTAGFTAAVGIMRGGMIPALMVSFETGLPVHALGYERTTGQTNWIGNPPPPGTILLCEDVAGMGLTLVRCVAFAQRTHSVSVLTLASDERSRLLPDWTQRFEGVQVVFPWERHDQVPDHLSDWNGGGAVGEIRLRPDHEYVRIAVDVAVLRDAAVRGIDLRLEPGRHVLLAGAQRDQAVDTSFTSDLRVGGVAIERPDTPIEAHMTDADWRISRATALGCDRIVDDDAERAMLIASRAPWLRVYWWRRGEPLLLTAGPLDWHAVL